MLVHKQFGSSGIPGTVIEVKNLNILKVFMYVLMLFLACLWDFLHWYCCVVYVHVHHTHEWPLISELQSPEPLLLPLKKTDQCGIRLKIIDCGLIPQCGIKWEPDLWQWWSEDTASPISPFVWPPGPPGIWRMILVLISSIVNVVNVQRVKILGDPVDNMWFEVGGTCPPWLPMLITHLPFKNAF